MSEPVKPFARKDEGIHVPSTQPMWQESLFFCWWDENAGIGGIHRLGQEPNQGKANYWHGLFTADGLRYRSIVHTLDLVESDRQPMEMRAGPQSIRFGEDGDFIDFSEADTSVKLRFKGYYPMCEVWRHGSGGSVEREMAANHFENSGSVTGSVSMAGREYTISGQFHRDHSWGLREWSKMYGHRWAIGTAGPDLSFAGAVMLGTQDVTEGGFVIRNGIRIAAERVDFVVFLESDGVSHRGGEVTFHLEDASQLGIRFDSIGGFIAGHGGMILTDQLCRFRSTEGHEGFGLLEASINTRLGTGPVNVSLRSALQTGYSQLPTGQKVGDVRVKQSQ